MTELAPGQFDDGAAYERLMGRWSRIAGREFLRWCAVGPGKDWLDVGCGNGAFTEEILSLAAPQSATGIDPSPGQITFAKARNSVANYHVGDALALDFADQTFDATVMALAIAFVPNAQKAVDEMVRVTRLGGMVATYMWDLQGGGVHLAPISRVLRDMGLRGQSPPSADASRLENLEMLWRNAGMTNIETTVLSIDVHFSSFNDFCTSNMVLQGPLGETLKTLTTEKMATLESMLRQTLPIAADGSITYIARANAVKGFN